MPIGLINEIFQKPGDIFTYCISTDKQRVHGQLKYRADSCQVKFKMRTAAAYNKIPGFRKISGYEQFMKMGPGMLMTQGQMNHIIERTDETFPELAEIRRKVVHNNPR